MIPLRLQSLRLVARRWLDLSTGRRVVAWWLATRLVLFAAWAVTGWHSQGDVGYYWQNLDGLFHGRSPGRVLPEYPTPLIWILSLPYLLGFTTEMGFRIVFVSLFVLMDAWMTLMFWRTARRLGTNPTPTVGFWIIFIVAIGPIAYLRLDLLTAAVSAAAVITLVRHHRGLSGSMIGLGAAVKLWPALLWPAVLVDRRAVRRATVGFLVTGAALAAVSWLYSGWDRLVSPLRWQSDRGLQVESIWATPAMLGRLVDQAAYHVGISKYNAFEIAGPGTGGLITAASIATLIGGLTVAVLYVGWLRRKDRSPIEAGTLMVIATLIMIATNKTFSPQYMIWLGGPVAGLLTISERHPEERLAGTESHTPLSLARSIAGWILGLTVLTQLVYPITYDWLVHFQGFGTWLSTIILAVRNVVLAYFTVRLIALAFRSFTRRQGSTTAEPPDSRSRAARPVLAAHGHAR